VEARISPSGDDGLRKGTQVDFIGSEEARDAKAHQKKARQRSHRR
jgi:hypothetical protein